MTTATFSVRMDSKLKKNFKETCENFGLSVSSAINVFANAVVNQKRIPFNIVTKEVAEIKNGIGSFYDLKRMFMNKNKHDMSLDEINRVLYAKKKNCKKTLKNNTDIPFYALVLDKRIFDAKLLTGNIRHYSKKDFIMTAEEFIKKYF